MKIRTSLRLYVVGAMFIAGTLAIGAMSGVAVNYFFYGLDTAMEGFMRSQAFEFEAKDGEPVQLQEMTIATRWQDLPQPIQNMFDEESLQLQILEKEIDGIPLIKRPESGYFVMKVERDGAIRYTSVTFNKLHPERFKSGRPPQFIYIAGFAFGAIVLFGGTLILLVRRVSMPVKGLRNWAKGLDKEQLNEPIPNFRYSELNALADIIRSSLSSVQEGLEREKRFLGYASHELRTPIAVTRSNSELLQKMIQRGIGQEKQLEVLARIERASYTMTYLTETLLWLNRQEDKELPNQELELGAFVSQIQSELRYLLDGKSVSVKVVVDKTKYILPEALVRIVVTNLIRNAFQHTFEGDVLIEQRENRLVIVNSNVQENEQADDLGFGLGLELTERLVSQYGWHYVNQTTATGRRVELII
ncbi:sensor histidine kinase [Vibrio astriarenae]|uniref:sensor histidine kinase n=1 Tax=Vibrio astriarenae TaxID=1481923 RepID=UPI0037360B31